MAKNPKMKNCTIYFKFPISETTSVSLKEITIKLATITKMITNHILWYIAQNRLKTQATGENPCLIITGSEFLPTSPAYMEYKFSRYTCKIHP